MFNIRKRRTGNLVITELWARRKDLNDFTDQSQYPRPKLCSNTCPDLSQKRKELCLCKDKRKFESRIPRHRNEK